MKNIYLIPTNKPSRLYYKDGKYKLANSTMAMDWYKSSVGYKPINIHVTYEGDIKEGDWYLDTITNTLFKSDKIFLNGVGYKKIILTTDPTLIADWIQPISDDFLQWFVNNSSCESVEVEKENICARCYSNDVNDCWSAKECSDGKYDKIKYKIIFPKEEPKDVVLGYKTSIVAQMLDEPKQEW